MTKQEIIQKLISNHANFIVFIDTLSTIDFEFSKEEKWSAGQQLDHIYKSVNPLVLGFLLPKFFIGYWFGKANRPSKGYDTLVNKYLVKIKEGGKASGRFVPPVVKFTEKEKLKSTLKIAVAKLASRVDSFSEKQLDELILPHPLLGKVTVREMLYFTIYHVEHHKSIILRDLQK